MKIALLSEKYTPDPGGLAISVGRLAHLLASAGQTVRIFAPTLGLPASEQRTLPSSGPSVTRFGAHKRVDDTLLEWFELIVAEHRREPFDLLHAYFLPQAGFVAAYAGKYLGIPSVVSIRGNDIERAAFEPSRFSHLMYALQNASAVTTNASELARKAKAFLDREVILIPNGVDSEHFQPMERNRALADALGIDNGKKRKEERRAVVGFVGELREKKGLHTLLSGYAQIANLRPACLLIVGDTRAGDDKRAFESFQSAHPDAKIIVTGFVPHNDLPAYYSLMDIFVHASRRDGLPNALLEAMACGKAVVVTPVGGMAEVVEDRVNGLVVPVDDADALRCGIETLLDDASLRENLAANARREVIEKYSAEKELTANLAIYRNLLAIQADGAAVELPPEQAIAPTPLHPLPRPDA
jgi:glycosyltransferase involved in cell wall biosynthesis